MRRILLLPLLFMMFLLALQVGHAQSPPGINYQGIARNPDGKPLSQRDITIRINILNNGAEGVVEYAEVHSVKTNAFGLFTLVIGSGTTEKGYFELITWSTGNKWLRVEMDPDGGNSFQQMGAQQLMSVPYAFYAKYTDSSIGLVSELKLGDDHVLRLKEGSNVKEVDLSSLVSAPVTLEDKDEQDLSLNTSTHALTLTNDPTPSSINLAPYMQSLHLDAPGNSRTITIDGGVGVGFTVDDGDSDPTNELQQLTYNTATKSLTINGSTGNSVTIPETQNLNQVLQQGNDANGQRVSNIGVPVAANDATSKQYVDAGTAAINTRINSNYAFKAGFNFSTVLAVSEVTLPLSDTFDDFSVVNSTVFTAPAAGTYMFVLDGSSTGLLASSTINLNYNGTKYPVAIGTNAHFNSTFMFRLTAGQMVSVVATGLGVTTNVTGSFFGYKLL